MKLDPNNNDTMSSVGDDLGYTLIMFVGTVIGIDGCVYGIPFNSNIIVKYDPINDLTSFVGEENDREFCCYGNGALGRDGCIYAATYDGLILKINTINNSHCFVGYSVESDHDDPGWGDAILGIDGCIYWPPAYARRILKYDPHTNQASLVGDDFGTNLPVYKWCGGSLASDGVIYCILYSAERILSIDPWKEFSMTVKHNIEEYPQYFGFLFERPEQRESSSSTLPHHQTQIDHRVLRRNCKKCYNAVVENLQKIGLTKTVKQPLHHVCKINFDHAVVKFGQKEVIQVLEKHMEPVDEFCKRSNLPGMSIYDCGIV